MAKLDAADVNLGRTGLRAQLLVIVVVDTYVPARMTHDYLRHGSTSLFAELEVASGKVHGRCYRRHRHAEFIVFLESLAKRYPKLELHLICDNYGIHKHPAVKQWLAAHPRFDLHLTPTSGSWLNLVKRSFGLITAQVIRRGSFDSVARLEQATTCFLTNWNENAKPNPSTGPNPPIRSNAASAMLHLFTKRDTRLQPRDPTLHGRDKPRLPWARVSRVRYQRAGSSVGNHKPIGAGSLSSVASRICLASGCADNAPSQSPLATDAPRSTR